MDSKAVQVSIFGKEYTLRSSEAGQDHLKKVARYVDEIMRMHASQLSKKDPLKIAVLSALNIADELFRERREKEEIGQQSVTITEEIHEIIQNIEKEIDISLTEE